MFSINILRFARRSASVRPPHSFKYGVQNEDFDQKLNIDKNYISKNKGSSYDKNIFSNRKSKESETLTNVYEVEKVKKHKLGVNFEKFSYIEKEKSNLRKIHVNKDDKVNFVSYDLMKFDNERKVGKTKELLRKSHKGKFNFGFKDDIVFGIHPVLLALQSKRRKVYEIFYKKKTETVNKKIYEILQLADEMEIQITASSKKDIDSIVGGDRVHQGVCCHASVLPSDVIDDSDHDYISENIDHNRSHNKKQSNAILMSENLDQGNAIENVVINKRIFDNNVQTNNIDSDDVVKYENYSMLTHSDLLEKSGELIKRSREQVKKSAELIKKCGEVKKSNQNSLSKDSMVEMRAIHSSSESNYTQVWIYLDSVHDPMNLGAILRSSYFLGIDKVLVSQENSCRISGVVSKASAGVAEIIQVYQVIDPKKLIKRLQSAGWCTVVATASNDPRAVPVSTFTPTRNTLVLIGNEGTGVNESLSQLCDTAVTILPRKQLHPAVDSLNVSVATALLLHTITNNINQ